MRIHNVSLIGSLAMMTSIAIGISHVITSYRLSHANIELAALRQRLELIPLEDTRSIAARQLPSSDPRVRRWAVRVPADNPMVLYANWGMKPVSDIRDSHSRSIRAFRLVPDPATHEATIVFRVETNPTETQRGAVTFEIGGGKSVIAIDQEITSLLTGDTPSVSVSIGEKPATRHADSPIILLEIESNQDPKIGFSLWLDQPVIHEAR